MTGRSSGARTMRRAVIAAPGVVTVEDAPVPEPPPGHVRLRVTAAGICGSDLHTYAGANPVIPLPIAAGHEFAGTIDALGEGVTGLAIGYQVAARPSVSCGACEPCCAGARHLCDALKFVGSFFYDGAFAEYVVLPAACVIPAPPPLTAAQLTFVEPAAAAVHAVELAGDLTGRQALVIGCGTIGLLVAQVARLAGADVFVTDLAPAKIELARTLGMHEARPAGERFLDGAGSPFPVAFDCVGKQMTVTAAMRSIRKGGRVVLVGVPTGPVTLDPVDLLVGERAIAGSYIYREEEFNRALALIRSGELVVAPLVTATYPLERIAEAFAVAAGGNERVKLLIDPQTGEH